MNFFRIIFSICRETSRFPELSVLPLYRAILHLLLLAIILAGVTVGLQYPAIESGFSRAEKTIRDNFGQIQVTPQGLLPSLDPKQARKVEMLSGILLEYFPSADIKPQELQTDKYEQGVVWTPGVVVMWRKGTPVIPVFYSTKLLEQHREFKLHPATSEGIIAAVKDLYAPAGPFFLSDFSFLFSWLMRLALGCTYIMYFLIVFGGALLFTTLFTGFYSLGGGIAMIGLKFKNLWLIGLYAGMPALIVASVVTGLNLPYVDFSTVYLFGFLGYFFFIISRMQRDTLKRDRDPSGDDDE